VRLTLLSRASDLARLQALLVARALEARWPGIDITLATRVAAGDRDTTTPLVALQDKGAFTADLSEALASGDTDAVVHSWKDLPLDDRPGLGIAATLERADPRDVLLVRRDALTRRPSTLRVLSSSPRRGWLLGQILPELLPWRVDSLEFLPVRGNIATRLSKLIDGRSGSADALVVAKAALDRLLGFGPPFDEAARTVRELIAPCLWMVLPIREVPGAPAQGALAVEARRGTDAFEVLRAISHDPTWHAVMREREVLASYGGGCHEALGATVLPRAYGSVVSVRGRSSAGREDRGWSLVTSGGEAPPRTTVDKIWPRPEERHRASRRPLAAAPPGDDTGLWVARAEALPDDWSVDASRLVWGAGSTTWRRLATRGVWVNGCADGLGDTEPPAIDALAGRQVEWRRLTHHLAAAEDPAALATYAVDEALRDDLPSRTHFFWTSGTLFRRALERWPALRECWHGSGPGRTWKALQDRLGPTPRARVWLDYDDWKKDVVGDN
jgi:hydroxymethylbilane synthase